MKQKVFFLTGELSGETHAAHVVAELFKAKPDLEIKALGSKILKEFGVDVVVDYKNYSFSGFTEVVENIGKIFKLKHIILNELKQFKPDVLVLVDYGGFNLEIASAVKSNPELRDIKIVEFIAPQIWASRPHRIKKIKKNVDKVLCTLPFEEEIYQKENIPVRYVGNPIVSSIADATDKSNFLKLLKSPKQKSNSLSDREDPNTGKEILVGIFPGSRKSEVRFMLPIMIEAAKEINEKLDHKFKFILAQAPTISTKVLLENGLEEVRDQGLIEVMPPGISKNANQKLLSAADLLWLCSGTVTLEAALYGTPYFLSYKGDWLSYQLYKFFKIIDMAGLANIIAGEYIVPEFLQHDASKENFVNQTLEWLTPNSNSSSPFTEKYFEIKDKLLSVTSKLSNMDTSKLVAEEILKV